MIITIDNNYLEKLDSLISFLYEEGTDGFDCCIAGGAIRDSLLFKPIKDIDVFYTLPYIFGNPAFSVVKKQPTDLEDAYPSGVWVVTHQQCKLLGLNYPIQLIKCLDIDEQIESFGVNLSKVWYGADGLWMSNEFRKDAKDMTLTFTGDLVTENYIKKIKDKYPTFTPLNENQYVFNF